jgi:S-layer protein (TIGR01567 family)
MMQVKVYLGVSFLLLALIWLFFPCTLAQEPVEAAYVRGHFSTGDGIWLANDFGWFYYDLDDSHGGEQLSVSVNGRTIEKNHIIYNSTIWPAQFEYEPWGSYQSIAFLGKHYLAGYPESFFTDEISSLDKGELRKVLIDTDEQYALTSNTSLPLMEGYVLAIKEVSSSNDEANLILLKNNRLVDFAIVNEGGTYVYKVQDIPVILVHLADIMRDENGGRFCQVDGIFQITDVPDVKMREGAKLENLEVTDISEIGLELNNFKVLTLTRNSVIPLGGGLELIVLDDSELTYYLQGGIFDYGMDELRGPVFTASSKIPVKFGKYSSSVDARWDSTNFTGFYFDPEKMLGAETLVLSGIEERTLPPPSPILIENNTALVKGLQYTSIIQPKQFEFEPWGYYNVGNFLGQQWFSGYGNETFLETDLDSNKTNLRSYDQLGKVLIDTEISGIVVSGNYSLAEGYEVFLRDVSKEKIFINLKKDGQIVDSSILIPNTTYVYKKDLGDANDMPIIAIHVNNVFANETERFATIDGIFQLSEKYIIPIEPGSGIEKVEIVSTPPNFIGMRNNEVIHLNPNSDISLWPGMNIRVADNDTLRYYLYTLVYVVPSPRLAKDIDYQQNVRSSSQANFSMITKAGEIIEVLAEIINAKGKTVYLNDITNLGRGSGDQWAYFWTWNATTMKLSDDGSQIMEAGQIPIPAVLYLGESTPPISVGVKFDESGRIARIANNTALYYISPSEYSLTRHNISYGDMLNNSIIRGEFIKIDSNESRLRFIDMDAVNSTSKLSGTNHTLSGSLAALEPHAERIPAPLGSYELKVKIENPSNALRIWGIGFNVTAPDFHGISIDSSIARGGKPVSVRLDVPNFGDKRVSISYDSGILKATGASGPCQTPFSLDQKAGKITVSIPTGCNSTNLTFLAKNVNASTDLKVIDFKGFQPAVLMNGSITVLPEDKAEAKKSDGLLIVFAMRRN